MHDVLVVDDDPSVRTVVTIALEGSGLTMREAADGVEALDELEKHPPALMVLDVMMPGVDGFGVMRARRRRNLAPETRVLMLTAKTSESDFVQGFELGVDEYMPKPFDVERLAVRVRELMVAYPGALVANREEQLAKAEMLARLEAAFARPPRTR